MEVKMEVNFTLQRYIFFDILQKKCLKFCGFLSVCDFFYNFAPQYRALRARGDPGRRVIWDERWKEERRKYKQTLILHP
jgi:hypothetical protein